MSVEALLVRVTPSRVDELQRAPEALADEVEALLRGSDPPAADRGVVRGERVVRLDEWSATLAAPGNLDADHPLARAVRFGRHPLPGVEIGYGEVLYNAPEDVERIAGELKELRRGRRSGRPTGACSSRTTGSRTVWAGYPSDGEGVLRRAAELLELLEGFYRDAAAAHDGVIVAAV